MEPKKPFSVSRITYTEFKTVDSQIIIECDSETAAIILEFVAKLKVEILNK